METTDNTLKEMQQQMELLKNKLDKQTIVNDKMMRNAIAKGLKSIRTKAAIPYFAGLAAILCCKSFYNLGCSLGFLIYSELMIVFCLGATWYTNCQIPKMDEDLLTAAGHLTRFKKIHAEWLKIGIPLLMVWLGWLIMDMFRSVDMSGAEVYALMAGIGVGLIIGLAAGLKVRRELMDGAQDLIDQIKDMQEK